MDNIIEQYYLDNNYPSSEKLYKMLKKDNHSITLKKVKEWLSKQETEQIMKPVKKSSSGHIGAFKPNEFWNIDIFDLSKYDKYNSGYKYIFCAIDIFTRKAYCIAMKTKSNDSVLNAIENIITSSNKPTVIISDSDSTFLSKQFQKLLEQNNIIHNTVPLGDHHSLGVIDRFALTLKRILSKHSGLNNLTPNEAAQKKT